MIRVVDRIGSCWESSGERPIPMEDRTLVVVHRSGMGETAREIATAFRGGVPEAANAVGHKMPYHLVVCRTGQVEQAVPLMIRTPHAAKWNRFALAVAVVGDFRKERPTEQQNRALVALCAALCQPIGGPLCIKAHDSLVGGSTDPRKECPGKFLDVARLQADVRALLMSAYSVSGIKLAGPRDGAVVG